MDLTKREKIGLCIFAVIIIFILSIFYFNNKSKTEIEVINKNQAKESNYTSQENKIIKVYIAGEIKKPGVYSLCEGDRVIKLVEAAGGFTDRADISSINLAMKLRDEDYIKVPEKVLISQGSGTNSTGTALQNQKINLNTADKEQLKTLPRIGDAMAQRIIDYREKNGLFKRIEDLKKVSGIGEKVFENLKDKITVY